MTDANLRSIRIFAHKKTIKQFLQPMIEQVWGRGDVPFFLRQFFRATVFLCRFFINSPIVPFLGRFYKYLHIFAVYHMYFIKKSNSVLGTKFS